VADPVSHTTALTGVSTASYRITDGPDGRRWWAPYEALPTGLVFVRVATPAETFLMERISHHRNPPLKWGDRIKEMIANG